MSLKHGKVNELSLLGMRKLTFIPTHFQKLTVGNIIDVKLLDHWINYNLNSRYAIKKTYVLDNNKKMIEVLEIGVEDPKEITLLTLSCPYLYNERK